MTGCTLSGNSTQSSTDFPTNYGGGALHNEIGTVLLTNCTLAGNSAEGPGGGLHIEIGDTTLVNCTLSDNSASAGGGIFNEQATVTLINTIVANSPSVDNCDGSNSSFVTGDDHNLSSDGTCFTSGGSDLINTDPQLGPLADNGGPTKTMELLTG